jgi:hypothetical protein
MAQTRITSRSQDHAQWYRDVIGKAELARAAGVSLRTV